MTFIAKLNRERSFDIKVCHQNRHKTKPAVHQIRQPTKA